jgi:acyl carrier protein
MKDKIRNLLAVNSGIPFHSITEDANLSTDLGLDSLDTVDLVLQMEDMFKISIPDEDYQHFQTVKQFYEYLQEKVIATA